MEFYMENLWCLFVCIIELSLFFYFSLPLLEEYYPNNKCIGYLSDNNVIFVLIAVIAGVLLIIYLMFWPY